MNLKKEAIIFLLIQFVGLFLFNHPLPLPPFFAGLPPILLIGGFIGFVASISNKGFLYGPILSAVDAFLFIIPSYISRGDSTGYVAVGAMFIFIVLLIIGLITAAISNRK